MSATKTCPQCSKPLPAGAPEGLCPECLVKVGISSEFAGGAGTPTVKGPPPPLAIDNIARHFPQLEIMEQLGQGGMGVVYKARQRELDRLVALKVLPPDIGRDAAFVERFQREARALARLNHPNIVAVYDFGTTAPLTRPSDTLSPHPMRGEGRGEGSQPETSNPKLETSAASLCYFIMEFVDGANLRQLQQTKKLTPQEALAIVPKVCEALQFAHDEGIVHRDIKPENILVDKKGRVKIADFGLAKLLGKSAPDFALTGPQTVMGTPHYMAPEQIQGTRDVDHRADIYSLGVVFYEMLTGELPLGRFAPPSQKVQVDVRLDEVVLKALEQEPSLRYQQASEVKTQVETISGVIANLPPTMRQAFGWEYKSKTEWFGLPLVHIASGVDLQTGKTRVACGIIAIGGIAKGVLAFGGASYGVFAFGGFAVGLFTCAGCGVGLVSIAGLAIALVLAYGGMAIAPVALGGLAVGYYAFGGGTFGVHALGGNANDPEARRFFSWVMHNWKYVNIGGLVLMANSFLVPMIATICARQLALCETNTVGTAGAKASGPLARLCNSWAPGGAAGAKKSSLLAMSLGVLVTFLLCAVMAALLLNGPWRKASSTGQSAPASGVTGPPDSSAAPISYNFGGETGFVKGPNGPIYSQAKVKEFGFTPLQVEEVNKITARYYRDFLSLERQHTSVTTGANGLVNITIAPFRDEAIALAGRMVKEIRGTTGKDIVPNGYDLRGVGIVGFLGLFRHEGTREVKAALWKDREGYHFTESFGADKDEFGGQRSGGSRTLHGKTWKEAFPEEYWIYWKE